MLSRYQPHDSHSLPYGRAIVTPEGVKQCEYVPMPYGRKVAPMQYTSAPDTSERSAMLDSFRKQWLFMRTVNERRAQLLPARAPTPHRGSYSINYSEALSLDNNAAQSQYFADCRNRMANKWRARIRNERTVLLVRSTGTALVLPRHALTPNERYTIRCVRDYEARRYNERLDAQENNKISKQQARADALNRDAVLAGLVEESRIIKIKKWHRVDFTAPAPEVRATERWALASTVSTPDYMPVDFLRAGHTVGMATHPDATSEDYLIGLRLVMQDTRRATVRVYSARSTQGEVVAADSFRKASETLTTSPSGTAVVATPDVVRFNVGTHTAQDLSA